MNVIFCHFLYKSFAKHMNDFIFDFNPKKLKKKALNPKYKQISKPDFWPYENYDSKFLPWNVKTISIYKFLLKQTLSAVLFL